MQDTNEDVTENITQVDLGEIPTLPYLIPYPHPMLAAVTEDDFHNLYPAILDETYSVITMTDAQLNEYIGAILPALGAKLTQDPRMEFNGQEIVTLMISPYLPENLTNLIPPDVMQLIVSEYGNSIRLDVLNTMNRPLDTVRFPISTPAKVSLPAPSPVPPPGSFSLSKTTSKPGIPSKPEPPKAKAPGTPAPKAKPDKPVGGDKKNKGSAPGPALASGGGGGGPPIRKPLKVPVGGIPRNYNGTKSQIDLAGAQERVKERAKIFFDQRSEMDLACTMAYILAVDHSKEPIAGALTSATLTKIGHVYVIYHILAAFAAANVRLRYRSSDIYYSNQYDDLAGEHAGDYMEAAQNLWEDIQNDPDVSDVMLSDARSVIHALVACAIHRKRHEGHSWKTQEASRVNSEGAKICMMATGFIPEFVAFMKGNGHDIWHFLDDDSINVMCDHLCGDNDNTIQERFIYAGSDRNGSTIHGVFKITQSASDRWPVGTLGIAGSIKGLEAMTMMINDICSKVPVDSSDSLIQAIEAAALVFKNQELTRAEVLAARVSIGGACSMAYGYVKASPVLEASLGSAEALESASKSHASNVATGGTLHNRVRELKSAPGAASALIRNCFNVMTEGMLAFSAAHNTPAPNHVLTPVITSDTIRDREAARDDRRRAMSTYIEIAKAARDADTTLDAILTQINADIGNF